MAAFDTTSMALFCDFENVALGVRDAKYEKFDIQPILERLLAKGSIVVKKAYCDWERYKTFKAAMHEANFELIEIPHLRQSGKNSADIRMVVDALDLCYTKAHVDTFVIISGDSDFSPLVSKLRENAKHVIGVGIKQSTSDLLMANCDEFIFYDDLVREREAQRAAARREQQPKRSPEEEKKRREEIEEKKAKAIELAAATFSDLIAVRSDVERIWASALKEAIKRRNPGFNESYYGYKTFGSLLDDAAARGHFEVGRDDKSGTFVTRSSAKVTPAEATPPAADEPGAKASAAAGGAPEAPPPRSDADAARQGGRKAAPAPAKAAPPASAAAKPASATARRRKVAPAAGSAEPDSAAETAAAETAAAKPRARTAAKAAAKAEAGQSKAKTAAKASADASAPAAAAKAPAAKSRAGRTGAGRAGKGSAGSAESAAKQSAAKGSAAEEA